MHSGDKVPLVGSALDGGANLIKKIDDELVSPLSGLAAQLNGLNDRRWDQRQDPR